MKKSIIGFIIFIGLVGLGFWFLRQHPTAQSESAQVQKLIETSKDEVSMSMGDNGYEPNKIIIKKGTTIRFMNRAKEDRWPASNIHPTHEIYPEFDPQRPVAPGSEWSFTFDKAGIWYFHDHLSPEITGSIVVE